MSTKSYIERRSEDAAGAYTPNHFLLRLDRDTPFVSRGSEPNFKSPHFSVFVHEYWHYWHNISTLSGLKDFAYSLAALCHFSRTLQGGNGKSLGSEALSDADRADLAGGTAIQQYHTGDPGPPKFAWAFGVDCSVESWQPVVHECTLKGGVARAQTTELTVKVTEAGKPSCMCKFEVGSLAIEESVTLAVERAIATGLGLPFDSTVPVFPYRVIERFGASLVGQPLDDFAIMGLGTLALLYPDPGLNLLCLLEELREILNRGSCTHS